MVRNAFIFRFMQAVRNPEDGNTTILRNACNCNSSHGVTTQKTVIFSNTAVRTLNIPKLLFPQPAAFYCSTELQKSVLDFRRTIYHRCLELKTQLG
jgi:hypothetical protein